MLRIALPNKGRLAEDARRLFDEAGLEVRASGERALTASLGGAFEGLFVRAQDIPEFVADGAADAGVTGWDLVAESNRSLRSLADLQFGRCRVVVAAREESDIDSVACIPNGARVATVFPRITARFFSAAGRPDIDIVPVSGAAEVAPHLGIADIVVDLVSTGSTLRVNGLREVATVLASTARVIVAGEPAAEPRSGLARRKTPGVEGGRGTGGGLDPSGERPAALEELVTALESVVRARGKRYLMANVPRDALADVRRILPGLNGPTVVDVLDGGRHVAVHAVVSADNIYRTIGDLKALGAEGILVTRIERLMP